MTKNSILIPSAAIPVTKAVFVMLGNGFDEIEAIGPVDVMRRGGIEVYTVSMTENRLVKGATGNLIVADMALSDLRPEFIDWLVFPGADKAEEAVNLSTELSETVGRHWREGGNIAAICAAPALVLGPLGILKDEEATGYPFLKDDFIKRGGRYSESSVVVGDRLITSQGPGTTLDFALALVRRIKGPDMEQALREGMVIS
ncbi:DJ-1 family protein [Muribaculaceae bacterium Isolate-110 (HZI)]|nr:DJ-1 family protein [Muribaculaceae bacterium Isolate-110 (HZI)]